MNKLFDEIKSSLNNNDEVLKVDNYSGFLGSPNHETILFRINRILSDLSTSIDTHPMNQELVLTIKIAGNFPNTEINAEIDSEIGTDCNVISSCCNNTRSTKGFKRIRFPAKKPEDTWRFCVYLRLLTIIEFNLHYGKIVTMRDLYYQDISLFKSQKQLKTFVENITSTLDCESHHDLNIFPSQKGLIWGNFTVYHKSVTSNKHNTNRDNNNNNNIVNINITNTECGDFIQEFKGQGNTEPTLIPYAESIRYIQLPTSIAGGGREESSLVCVLVVEKESVFRTLIKAISVLSTEFSSSNIILVTGRGYPDFVTRAFLSIFNQFHPRVPIWGLVDSDPYGIHIHCVYKYGSVRMYRKFQQQIPQKLETNKPPINQNLEPKKRLFNNNSSNNNNNKRFMVPTIQFMGVSILDYQSGWVHLTLRDRQKAVNMLLNLPWLQNRYQYSKYNIIHIDSEDLKLRSELQRGLFLGLKAEMNIVKSVASEIGDDIGKYVSDMIRQRLIPKQGFDITRIF